MGEVYRARDTRLDRSVAIKILPAELAANAALKLRFEREAKTISSLSHPHICSLYDVGESDTRSYLVMEYLEGESLADRLTKGPLPIDQVLKLGVEIASALDAAHRQAVTHRDIKPANIMLTKSGAKLLDFGLATANQTSDLGPQASELATKHKPLTDAGTIIGTFQYMAPEQVEGQQADARTDIFALGAVLYEAATGKRAFEGKSRASLIAAILDHEPPPISTLRDLAPPALDRVVRACLRKDPAERIQTAHDLMLDLTWIRESSSAGEGLAVAARRRRKPWIMLALIAALVASTITFAALYFRARSPHSERSTFALLPAPGGTFTLGLAVSPDGRSVAYCGTIAGGAELLWIRNLSDPEPHSIAGTEDARWPFWSPDGQWVAFFARERLKKVNVRTGSLQDVCATGYGAGGAWGPDGTIVFAARFNDALYRVPSEGGEAVAATKLNAARHESIHAWPKFLSDGSHFLFLDRTTAEQRNQIAVGSLDSGEMKLLMSADALVGFDRPYVLFVRESVLYAQKLDESALALTGEPVEVAGKIDYSEEWGMATVSAGPSGLIAYTSISNPPVDLRVYDRAGNVLRTLYTGNGISEPQLSPDGKRIAVAKLDTRKGANDIWTIDLARDVRSRLTDGLANYRSPAWSPDGSRLAWVTDRSGMYDIYVKAVDEATRQQAIWRSDRDKQNPQWMPDGRSLITSLSLPDTLGDLYIAGINGEKPRAVVASESSEEFPMPSPDGRWIAYTSRSATAGMEVFVISSAGGRVTQVSTSGGSDPFWSRNGRELFYEANDRRLMSVPVQIAGNTFDPGAPKPLFLLPRMYGGRFSLTPDGNFLLPVPNLTATDPDHIHILMGWREKL